MKQSALIRAVGILGMGKTSAARIMLFIFSLGRNGRSAITRHWSIVTRQARHFSSYFRDFLGTHFCTVQVETTSVVQ